MVLGQIDRMNTGIGIVSTSRLEVEEAGLLGLVPMLTLIFRVMGLSLDDEKNGRGMIGADGMRGMIAGMHPTGIG